MERPLNQSLNTAEQLLLFNIGRSANQSPLQVARDESATTDELMHLLDHGDDNIVRAVCNNPSVSEEVLLYILEVADEFLWQHVARSPACSESVFLLLSTSMHWYVRGGVALRTRSVDLLEKLASDEDDDVRESVVKNPSATECLRLALINDKCNLVRIQAARSLRDIGNILRFSQSECPDVKLGIAMNKNCPSHILKLLITDGCFEVKEEAKANLKSYIVH